MTLGVDALDRGVHELNGWIKDIAERLGTEELRLAHCALRATLHALRDRIGPDHAAHLASQLPLLVRSIFYDGYNPAVTPPRERSRGAFLEQVHIEGVQPLDIVELERAVKVVIAVLGERTHRAQVENIARMFPDDFADLLPARKRHGPKRVGSPKQSVALKGDPRLHIETGIEEIDSSLQDALKWVNAVEFRLNTSSSELAMASLSATLQAIREQLASDQAARFADALPLALKGAFFEGWHPSSPAPVATREEFVERIGATAFHDENVAAERAVKAAMETIAKKVGLPEALRSMWPDEPDTVAPRQLPARSGRARPAGRATGRSSTNASSGSAPLAPHRSRS